MTTPQVLALADVEKGITMFNTVSIPTIAIVENMSSFECSGCGLESALFDKPGRSRRIAEQFGVPTLAQLPVDPMLSGGQGVEPFVLDPARRDRPLAKRLLDLADSVARELTTMRGSKRRYSLKTLEGIGDQSLLELKASSAAGNERVLIEARAARLACNCATCWDEMTGEKKFSDEDVPNDVRPTKIQTAGSYAVQIEWSDDHKSLMPYAKLENIGVKTSG